jgi:hypothetical protein
MLDIFLWRILLYVCHGHLLSVVGFAQIYVAHIAICATETQIYVDHIAICATETHISVVHMVCMLQRTVKFLWRVHLYMRQREAIYG